MATYSFHRLIMGKSGNLQFLLSHWGYLNIFFTEKVYLEVRLLSKSLDWLTGDIKGKFSQKYSKKFFSETIRRMKLKLGILA